ncbi:MAG: DUF4411 family protein [Gammaproteobacteria bacterium]|nr:DUF4411 family protein [Gammaproteobacteria bacterium]
MTRYILDANIFIQAKNLHYGFDFCPAFWEWLDRANETDVAASVEKVADELEVADDDLAAWVKVRRDRFFLSPDVDVASALDRVADWASSSGYESSAVTIFLQVADYWLIAHALAHNCVVVTHEVPADTVKKIKIPNACLALGLTCLTPYEMLRRERARFVLA